MDTKEWNSVYVDRSKWIFENLDQLSLNASEALVLLVINYLMETNQPVTYDAVVNKTHLDIDQVDACFESLSDKGYMAIDARNAQLNFVLDGLLGVSAPVAGKPIDGSLISEFSEEFARPLSGGEMERIMELQEKYEESMVRQALDEAVVYDRRSLSYVETVLASWASRGLSAEDVEMGKR